jgi:murein DD-endopeptidase MepM/ murein hydrolase activator NlpD
MRVSFNRVLWIVLGAAALGACATEHSQYPPYEGYAPPPSAPLRPAYPATADQAGAPASATSDAQPGPAQGSETDRYGPPPAPVSSEALPPVNRPPGAVEALPPVNRPPGEVEAPPVNLPPTEAEAPPAEPSAPARLAPAPLPKTPRRAPPPPVRYLVEGKVQAAPEPFRTLEVEKGDTVNLLATHYLATKKAIIDANKLKKPYELEVGRPLKVPTPKAYVVGAGDTLFEIARRFTVPAPLLAEINDFDKVGEHLHPGQKIVLPLQYKDIGPLRAPTPAVTALPPPKRAHEPSPPPAQAPPAEDVNAGRRPQASYAAPGAAEEPPNNLQPYRRVNAPPSGETLPPTRPLSPAPPVVPSTPPLSDAQVTAAGRGRFAWPVRGATLLAFGPMTGGQRNDGVDIAAPLGTPVQAASAGDVVYAGNQVPGFGNLVLIKHENGWVTAYAHLSKTEVKIKDHVNQGDEIGEVGQSGGVSQPQLHFEIRYAPTPRDKAKPIDPMLVLPR